MKLQTLSTSNRLCLGAISLLSLFALAGCNTYSTLDSRHEASNDSTVDESGDHYGQQYFLPKGLIHLVIKPEGGGGSGGDSSPATATATATSNPNVTITLPSGQAAAGPAGIKEAGGDSTKGTKDTKEEDLISPQAYTITATRVLVPDHSVGPFTARYNTNWFYSDTVSIGVTADGLLNTASADLSDRSGQVILNLAETAANVVRAGASSGLFSAKPENRLLESVKLPKHVYYRRLNIDITFDPYNQHDIDRVARIFADAVTETDDAIFVSPFQFDLKAIGREVKTVEGKEIVWHWREFTDPRRPLRRGLWFRELAPIEISLTPNLNTYANQVAEQLGIARGSQKSISTEAQKAKDEEKAIDEKVKASTANEVALKDAQADAQKVAQKIAQIAKTGDAFDTITTELKAAQKTALSHTVARTTRLTVSVPNPNRVFAFNVPRSAFVQNKKLALTISDGLLTKVDLTKPSEAEGFSEIPLELSKKLASVANDVLTLRVQRQNSLRDASSAQLSSFNNQTDLQKAIATREEALKTAQLQAQKAQLQAEIDLLQQRKNLLQTQGQKP